jgi:anthranilate/para-aminobenzoate synthase component I
MRDYVYGTKDTTCETHVIKLETRSPVDKSAWLPDAHEDLTSAYPRVISSPMDSRDILSAPARRFFPFSGERGAILLESQRPDVRDRYSYLLKNPVSLLSTSSAVEVPRILEEASARQMGGFAVAGYVSYEAGFAFDAVLSPINAPTDDFPLAWFGIYPGFLRFDHLLRRWESSGSLDWPDGERGDPPPPYGSPIDPRFSFTETEYGVKVEEIRRCIATGRYYQANLTGKFSFPFTGDPFSLYTRLRAIQPVKYGAFLRTDAGCILSQSPELFFRVHGRNIEVQSMKGTAARERPSAPCSVPSSPAVPSRGRPRSPPCRPCGAWNLRRGASTRARSESCRRAGT